MKAEVDSLWILLACSSTETIEQPRKHAAERKRYCEMRLSVKPFVYTTHDPDIWLVRLSKQEATRLIDYLLSEGYLRQAVELGKQKIPPRTWKEHGYALQVSTRNLQLHEDLGWGPTLLKRLDGLREVLGGDAASAMDAVLARLNEDGR